MALDTKDIVEIPHLTIDILELIFSSHAAYLEQEEPIRTPEKTAPMQALFGGENMSEAPFKFGFSPEGVAGVLQHNPEQAHSPLIPKEILEKIGTIAKIVAPEDPLMLAKPELHCNCPFCQVARTIQDSIQGEGAETSLLQVQDEEEAVSDEDLQFQQWEIQQTSEKLFSVTNRLDTQEKYSVYLGHPVGCTCGKQGCEHILAVLKS
jgi:hypothetical protein